MPMFPDCDLSMHVMWGRAQQNTVYTVGKSIFDRSNPVAVGDLMLEYGGGGHHAAGTCQGPNETADEQKAELIERLVALSGRVKLPVEPARDLLGQAAFGNSPAREQQTGVVRPSSSSDCIHSIAVINDGSDTPVS